MYALYKLNPQYLSPVQSGSAENSEIIVSNRQQWVGFDGAPKTLGVSANIKWKYNKGLGFLVYQDQAGPMRVTNMAADFAYHVRLNAKWIMSGGVRTGFLNLAYVFENPISQISKISTQTHEFALRFTIKPKIRVDEFEKEKELMNK
jgi:hypothetical protein